MKIVLVCIGTFQEYLIYNIKQLLLHNNNEIVIITEKIFFDKLSMFLSYIQLIDISDLNSKYIKDFEIKSNLDKTYRNGFWHNCSLRFWYIYEYMNQYNVNDIIHIENDIMIYENLDKILSILNNNKIYLTFDAFNRVIPGIMYIPNHTIFKTILDNYNTNENDMVNLGKYINSPIVDYFPIISSTDELTIYNKNFQSFNAIFDAAAIGQYLGGIDKKNDPNDTRGFINETCVIKYNNYSFYWIKIKDLWNPYIKINNKLIKIINLHIHSKLLDKFTSDNPVENKFIYKYQ